MKIKYWTQGVFAQRVVVACGARVVAFTVEKLTLHFGGKLRLLSLMEVADDWQSAQWEVCSVQCAVWSVY